MKTQLYYQIEVRDREGKLLKRERRKSRSFVQAWNKILYVLTSCLNLAGVVDTSGTSQTVLAIQGGTLRCDAAAADATNGVVVGTGTTAVSISDTALGTIIANGSGAGQLNYLAVTFGAPSVSGSSCSFTVQRIANNGSGASITVTEIGIYCKAANLGGTVIYLLTIRDVLASSLAVPNGGAITVTYTIKVTV